jgi:hypothetical protein
MLRIRTVFWFSEPLFIFCSVCCPFALGKCSGFCSEIAFGSLRELVARTVAARTLRDKLAVHYPAPRCGPAGRPSAAGAGDGVLVWRLHPRGDVEPRRRRAAGSVPAGRRGTRPRAAAAVRRAGEVGRLAPESLGRPSAAASQEHGSVRRPCLPRLHSPSLGASSIDRIRAEFGGRFGA